VIRTGTFLLHLLHLWVWALYAGSLIYIYCRLFPDIRRWLGSEERFEAFSLMTADGLRWWIFGALIAAGLTGLGLAVLRSGQGGGTVWWTLLAAKTVIWVVLLIVYAYVSYVMWPRRVFVATADRPAEQRRFAAVAGVLVVLLMTELVLGAMLHQAR
jgi:hypothetical protein